MDSACITCAPIDDPGFRVYPKNFYTHVQSFPGIWAIMLISIHHLLITMHASTHIPRSNPDSSSASFQSSPCCANDDPPESGIVVRGNLVYLQLWT